MAAHTPPHVHETDSVTEVDDVEMIDVKHRSGSRASTHATGHATGLTMGGSLQRENSASKDTEAALAAIDPGVDEEKKDGALPNGGYGWVIVLCILLLNASTWGTS